MELRYSNLFQKQELSLRFTDIVQHATLVNRSIDGGKLYNQLEIISFVILLQILVI